MLIASSCASTKRLVYFSDLSDANNYTEAISNKKELNIQPDDLLSITVNSLNAESNVLFNSGVLQTTGSATGTANTHANEGYLVDKDGNINFPVLGKIHLAGQTKEQASDLLTTEIKKSVKNPIVNVKFLNFRITVLGEVNKPSTFSVTGEKINLLEALGLAGDLTVYGRRDNILVIREANGIRSTTRVNLTSASTLNSPIYYLQQNDIVYIEPAKVKALQSSNSSFFLPLVSLSIAVLGAVLFIIR